jgi:adenine-specific DNA-methyltransferase
MSKREDAAEILMSMGLPKKQQNERSSLTLLALAGLAEQDSWADAKRPLLRIWDIMGWMEENYAKVYAANSRETIRRQTVHQFEQARLIDRNPDDPTRPTNSGETRYQLTSEAASVLRSFGRRTFAKQCGLFIERHGSLSAVYAQARSLHKVPVTLPGGARIELSPGVHNDLQRLIVEEFAPRFAPGSVVLYLGDTANTTTLDSPSRVAGARRCLGRFTGLSPPQAALVGQPFYGWLRVGPQRCHSDRCHGLSRRPGLRS